MGLSYSQVIHELENRGVMPDRVPHLDRMRAAAQSMRWSVSPERVILVAGTNGKGSVCATLEALLLSAGQRVGLYTSPHLQDTTERIRLQGQKITETVFVEVYHSVMEQVSQFALSHFEMLTLMAMDLFFSRFPVDYAIFEVGLGGLWDATNVIPHQFSIITSLGYDHQNLLGNSLVDIARNKFGIVSQCGTVVHSELPEEVRWLAREVQQSTQSDWIPAQAFDLQVTLDSEPRFLLKTPWGEGWLKLPGRRGAQNTATALTLFERLGFCVSAHLTALATVYWPCRMERYFLEDRPVYLSGDHNEEGVRSLLELLGAYPRRFLWIMVGIGVQKDFHAMLTALAQIPQSALFLTQTPFQGRSLKDYGPWLKRVNGFDEDPKKLLHQIVLQAQPQDLILVTGSLYLVGSLIQFLKK